MTRREIGQSRLWNPCGNPGVLSEQAADGEHGTDIFWKIRRDSGRPAVARWPWAVQPGVSDAVS